MNNKDSNIDKPAPASPSIRTEAAPLPAEHWRRQAARHGLVALMVAVGASLTVALSYVPFGGIRAHLAVALTIALFQAGCVGWLSMHLKDEPETIGKPVLLTVVIMAALIGLSMLGFADRAHY